MTSIQLAQEEYKKHGWITFPLNMSRVTKETDDGQIEYKKGVHPPPGFQQFTLETQPTSQSHHNALGLLTGEPNKIFVLDIDVPDQWYTWLKTVGHSEEELGPVVRQVSAKGGFHLFFKYDHDKMHAINGRNDALEEGVKIDSRSTGNFLFLTPTSFQDELVNWNYQWHEGRSILNSPITSMPDWILHALLHRKRNKKTQEKGPFFGVRCGLHSKATTVWGDAANLMQRAKYGIASIDIFSTRARARTFIEARNDRTDQKNHNFFHIFLTVQGQDWLFLQISPSLMWRRKKSLDTSHACADGLRYMLETCLAASMILSHKKVDKCNNQSKMRVNLIVDIATDLQPCFIRHKTKDIRCGTKYDQNLFQLLNSVIQNDLFTINITAKPKSDCLWLQYMPKIIT